MGTYVIRVQVPPVLQFGAFPINMPPEDLQDFVVILLVDGSFWLHQVLIKKALVVKEHG